MPRYQHIHLRGLGEASASFEPPGGGSTRRPEPVHDRRAHARRLRDDLVDAASAIQDTVDVQAVRGVPASKRGQALVLEGRANQDLDVGSGGVDSRGMQVFTIRRNSASSNGNGVRDEATVFVSERHLDRLLARLDAYENWKDGQRPHNFWLFESAESIRSARLEDFWTDIHANFPRGVGAVEWEVWIRDTLDTVFLSTLEEIGLEMRGGATHFVDTSVRNVVGTPRQIQRLVLESAAVVELRGASSFMADYSELPPEGRLQQVANVASRIIPASRSAPLVTLLDTGVNRNNPLLLGSLPESRCHVVHLDWEPHDADGHGTKMAGVVLFGDLANILADSHPIELEVGLESVVVSAPPTQARVPARDALTRAVALVERTPRKRVFCLAQTVPGEAEDGRPTSTSSTLDKLAFGDGDATRLICAAVGNVPTDATTPYDASLYDGLNHDFRVQSPAQSLNALSVGAVTKKAQARVQLVSPAGDLSPTSRTAQAWEMAHPHKPDIVMEGGNHVLDLTTNTSRPHSPNSVVTTSRNIGTSPITVTGETSAATAAAAGLAARVAARYPELRAETLRGLLTHSARWSDAMHERHAALLSVGMKSPEAYEHLLKCYGWGMPDEQRIYWSAENELTLIVEDDLRPYRVSDNNNYIVLREMKYFKLPWADDALLALGGTEVELRCTLSYFVEPDPHAASRDRLDRYPSHRLKFDFKRYDETDEQAQRRFNLAVDAPTGNGDDEGWLLGARLKSRGGGTLHQDVWRGPAYQLAGRNGVSVAPVRGWWGDRRSLNPEERRVHFSLIVSINSPVVTGNLFAEALTNVPEGVLVTEPLMVET